VFERPSFESPLLLKSAISGKGESVIKKYLGLALALSLVLVQQSAQGQVVTTLTLAASGGKQFAQVGLSKGYFDQDNKIQCYSLSDDKGIDSAQSGWWRPIKLKIDSATYDPYIGFIKKKRTVTLKAEQWAKSFKARANGDDNAIVFKITGGDTSILNFVTISLKYKLTSFDGKQFAQVELSNGNFDQDNKVQCYSLINDKGISSAQSGLWRPIKLKIDGAAYDTYVGFIKTSAAKLKADEWAKSFKAGANGDGNAIVFKITGGDTASLNFVTP